MSTPADTPRSLADQLRAWSTAELTALLELRPDLAVPAPADSAQLAARAATRTSVLRALDRLDRLQLTVLEAVASAGPLDVPELAEVVHASDVETPLAELLRRLLVWHDGRGLRALTSVVEAVGVPAGPDRDRVPALLAELDEPARAMLDHLDETGATGRMESVPVRVTTDTARTPAEQLLARRLLVPRDAHHVTVPWSVRLALRGGRSTREPVDVVPEAATSAHDPVLVDRAAAGAAYEVVRRVEVLLDHWGTAPPGALRAGGLGVRDLKAAAALLHVDEAEAALVVETAAAAGLLAIGTTEEAETAWLPTDRFDAWLSRDPATRWVELARAWLDTPRDAAAVGGSSGSGKRLNALADGLERSWLPGLRREVLDQLGALPAGAGLAAGTGLASLLDRLRWLRPRRPAGRERAVEAVLGQAAQLGLTARDALAGPARALLAGDDPAPVLADLLPAPVDHVLLQADLTAVAPGPLETELARRLALLADVESRGGATVYRFGQSSVRRAFDAGWSAAEVHEFVAGASRTPVPQSLTYLVDDVARRFGVLRVGQAESFLRSDDETALTELLHDPRAASLRLRRIAPTVVVSDVPVGTLLPRLRDLGLAPVVEAADGTVHVARPDVQRARVPRTRPPGAVRAAVRTAAVVAAVRAGDRAGASRPSSASVSAPADVVALLRTAAEAGDRVLIGYVGSDGTVAERLVLPRRVEGGRLTAYDERADDDRDFALHRITAAAVSLQL
jgi:hypothetical protein